MIYVLLVIKISTFLSLLSVLSPLILLAHVLYFYLILAKDAFICLELHAQIEFFPKLIIRVPHNVLFDT